MYLTFSIYAYIWFVLEFAICIWPTALPFPVYQMQNPIYISKQPCRFWATSIFMTLTNQTNIHNDRIVYAEIYDNENSMEIVARSEQSFKLISTWL